MANAFNYRVDHNTSSAVLNTMYAIFLGLLFTFFFHQEISGGAVKEVHFLVTRDNWLPVTFLSVYFVLDWLTTNLTVRLKEPMNHWVLMALILLVSYLGGLVVLAFYPRTTLYFLFAVYASVVPWWDKPKRKSSLPCQLVTYGIILMRMAVGLYMLFIVGIKVFAYQSLTSMNSSVPVALVTYVALKFFRYVLYVQFDLSS